MKHIVFFLVSSFSILSAQDSIFPDLSGDELLSELVNTYKPSTVLNYNNAREYMYEMLQSQKDTVEGIYTGYKIHLPDGVPSRVWVFENGINTEHIYPRSKGAASGNAFSDLHHLKPSKANVNSSRLNHPFKEIEDKDTKRWFRQNTSIDDVPADNIDEYSELDSFVTGSGFITGDFEPRESVKGDIARAVFYFFTMYNEEALDADPVFFEIMKEDLCHWHVQDEADEQELKITEMIAMVQDDKVNPFVMDCSLALRSYCSNMSLQCSDKTVPTIELSNDTEIKITPNPSSGTIHIDHNKDIQRVRIFNSNGQMVFDKSDLPSGAISVDLKLPFGLYFLVSTDYNNKIYTAQMVIQN